jgi:hypothetical protein
MFETARPTDEYPQGEWGRRRRWRRRRRWDDDDDNEFAAGAAGGSEFEWESDEFSDEGEGQYQGEGEGQYQGEDEGQYQGEDEGEGEDEDQFFPLIGMVAKALPSILGALTSREGEFENYEDSEDSEDSEAEEQFLGKLLGGLFGREAEYDEAPLTPAQEAEFAGRLLEVSDERELRQLIGRIVNTVGSAVQGVRGAARSPQGRALINAVTPVLQAAVPDAGGPPPQAVFEMQAPGMGQEQELYEAARQGVRLTAAAARNVASAPPDQEAEIVGRMGLVRAAQRHARPLFRHTLRGASPILRRGFGSGRFGFRRGYRPGYRFGYRSGYRYGRPYRRYYGGYRGPRYYGGYRGYGYPVGVPEPAPVGYPEPAAAEPPPGLPPVRPGYRWIQVPDVPDAQPPAEPPQPGPEAPPPPGPQPAQSEWESGEWETTGGYGYEAPNGNGSSDGQGGRWVRRRGKIVLLGA